ncbi:MAG: hypothetical protein ACK4NE_07745 [Albidovulum sp.]
MTGGERDPAHYPARTAFEFFLVEDVILTLGNLRGSLGWLAGDAEAERVFIDRIDRQLGLLQDRARRMAERLREAPPENKPVNLFAEPDGAACDDVPLADGFEAAILSGLVGPDARASAPVFRSRRG